ncbi:MAG: hypothetical protein K5871_08915 [Lachnospiraceae bacterium]|nr:hypothetical protein [Lachnospiraceae bacterium]
MIGGSISGSSALSGSGGASASSSALSAEEKADLVKQAGSDWIDGLSQDEKTAVFQYTGMAYDNINGTLRGLGPGFVGNNQKFAQNLHNSLDRSSIPTDCTVYRGISSDALGELEALSDDQMVGKVYADKGFLSTSLDKKQAFDKDVLLVIDVPKGAKGACVEEISAVNTEREVLFDCGRTMVVLDCSRDEKGKRIVHVQMM